MFGIGLLTGAYHVARRSGFLDTAAGRKIFLASYFAYKRYLEDPYLGLIRARPDLFRGGAILDVGANIGYCSVLFARAADPGSKVYAFEPEPFNFRLLLQAIEHHGVGAEVVPVQAAVGAVDGSLPLRLNRRHHADHRIAVNQQGPGVITVPVVSIDRYLQHASPQPVRFIKIDVQGYELEVCRGMEATLAANPDCVVALEYMPDALRDLGTDPTELLQWFRSRGYFAHRIRRNGRLDLEIPAVLPAGGWCDLLFSRAPQTASS